MRLPKKYRVEKNDEGDSVRFTFYFREGYEDKGFKRNPEIGFIDVSKDDNLVNQSFLNESLRGKGLGKMMYSYCIENLGKLKTEYGEASSMAKRVWESLEKKYKSKKYFFQQVMILYKTKKNINKGRKNKK